MINPFLDRKRLLEVEVTGTFDILVTSPVSPTFSSVGGTINVVDNLNGTYSCTTADHLVSASVLTAKSDITEILMYTIPSSMKSFIMKDCTAMTKFWQFPLSIPVPYLTDGFEMFKGCTSLNLSSFYQEKIITAESMYEGCVSFLKDETNETSPLCLNFNYQYKGCVNLTCVKEIDTTAVGATKVDMFFNTPLLTNPNAGVQTDLTDVNGAIHNIACP